MMLMTDVHKDDVDTVRALDRRRVEAMRINDADAMAPLLHDQLIYVNSVGEIYDKPKYLRNIRTHCLTYGRDFDVHENEVRVLDDLIILAGVMLGHSRLEGEQQVFHFRCIGVWRKEAGQWQMIAWQSSSATQGF